MRLEVKLLGTVAYLNNFKYETQVCVAPGENPNLYFQLFDCDTGNRYIPQAGATLQVSIPRYCEIVPTFTGQADPTDYSVLQNAAQPFPLDTSIWMLPLTSAQTQNLTSSTIYFTLTEGSNVKIAKVKSGLSVLGGLQ